MIRRLNPSRKGVAAVELAACLPLVMFLMLVAIDFCRIFYFSLTIQNAARNGAMWVSDPVEAAKSPYTTYTAAALSDCSNLSPQPTVATTSGTDANSNPYCECTVTWTFNTVTSFPWIPSSMTLNRTCRARVSPSAPPS